MIRSAHCTADAISDSVRGLGRLSCKSSVFFRCRATSIPATMANTRFLPSSIRLSLKPGTAPDIFSFCSPKDTTRELVPQSGRETEERASRPWAYVADGSPELMPAGSASQAAAGQDSSMRVLVSNLNVDLPECRCTWIQHWKRVLPAGRADSKGASAHNRVDACGDRYIPVLGMAC